LGINVKGQSGSHILQMAAGDDRPRPKRFRFFSRLEYRAYRSGPIGHLLSG
jgi:hypothetical protein